MTDPCTFHVGTGTLRPDIEPETLFLTVEDVKGTYTIPYIQCSRDLTVSVEFHDPMLTAARLELAGGDVRTVTREEPQARFVNLPPGEHELVLVGMGKGAKEMWRTRVRRIGIGVVMAALGASIVEGYWGRAVNRPEPLDLTARDFEPDYVSRDGRNFPQYSPTTHVHWPQVNCCQSWMTELNDLASQKLQQPAFIANEGLGGYTAEGYLKTMLGDAGWQRRMRLLQPNVWLIHIGINDERARRPADAFLRDVHEIVRILMAEYGAEPARIIVARPCYDYFEGAFDCLSVYCDRLSRMVREMGLGEGPDFFDTFSRDRHVWYGDDPVHPNVAGMSLMAKLWCDAIVRALGRQGRP